MRSLIGLGKRKRLRVDQPTIAVRTHPSFGRIQPAFACDCAFVDQLYSEIFWTALSERRVGCGNGGIGLLQAKALDIENDLRGTLRNFGLKVGMVGTVEFEARIRELVADCWACSVETQRSCDLVDLV
jgi:hypothetical protein